MRLQPRRASDWATMSAPRRVLLTELPPLVVCSLLRGRARSGIDYRGSIRLMIGQNRHRRLHRCLIIARAIKEEVQSNSVTGISEHGVMSAFWRDPAAIAPALVMRKLPVGLLCRRC